MDKEIKELIEINVKKLMEEGYKEEEALKILLIRISKNYLELINDNEVT